MKKKNLTEDYLPGADENQKTEDYLPGAVGLTADGRGLYFDAIPRVSSRAPTAARSPQPWKLIAPGR